MNRKSESTRKGLLSRTSEQNVKWFDIEMTRCINECSNSFWMGCWYHNEETKKKEHMSQSDQNVYNNYIFEKINEFKLINY